jgi:beta-glucuronidase
VLSEGWIFQPDPLEVGDAQRWFDPDLDRSGWRPVEVPMAWDFYDPVMDGYEGTGWYALELSRDKIVAGSWQRLRFLRANHRATVWIDGALAGENLTGYLPFEIALTPKLKAAGPTWIVVRIENGTRYDWLPGTTTVEWVQYGGLLEPVELLTTQPAFLAHASIRAARDGADGVVHVAVDVENTSDAAFAGRVRFEAGDQTVEADTRIGPRAAGRVSLTLRLPEARLWSPDSPALYDAKTRLFDGEHEIDAVVDRFGVRSIETAGRRLLLNGRTLRIRGVNRYDEFPGRGPVADEAEIRKDLLAVKELGANLVRVHYPQSPVNLRIADEIGLLFMEEVPLNWWRARWHPPPPRKFRNDRIIDVAEKALEQMILRDGNHPSIVIWSVANECEATDALGVRSMERLLRQAKALDPTRLTTYVANRAFEKNRAFALADLVAINLYYGMWDGEIAENLRQIEDRVHAPTRKRLSEIAAHYRDKPVLLTEFGTIGIPGSKGDLRFSETYQAAYLSAVWEAVEETPEISGGVVWCWADYRHRRGFTNEFPAYFGPFGLLTLDRQPKAAYTALRALWARP